MSRLRAEFEQSDRLARFENLKGFLIVSSEVPYAELAEGLDSPVQEALPEAVPAEVDEELRFLARALSPKGNTFT